MDSEQNDASALPQAGDGSDMPETGYADPTVSELSLAGSWADLIDRIKHTASELGEERKRLQQREELLHALARQTRDEVQDANERANIAESQAREIEARSQQEIAHWEGRARAAEAKLQTVEEWMAKMRAAVTEGFG